MDFGFDIVEAIKTYGLIPTIGLILLFSFRSYIGTAVSYIWKKIFPKKKVPDLNKHPAFHQMENYISVKIPSMVFEDPGRNEVFKDMLSGMFKAYINCMKKIITEGFDSNGEPIFASNEDFIQKMSMYGVQTIKDYENEWARSGIPTVCITSFNEWHSAKRDAIFSELNYLANSPFHETYSEKVAAFFDLINIVLNFSILDAELVLTDLNGELSGQIYKGITIGHENNYDDSEVSHKTKKRYSKRKSQVINFREES